MKKNMRRIAAMILALCMIFALTACGQPKLDGTWNAEVDVTDMVLKEIDMGEIATEMGIDTEGILDVNTLKFAPLPMILTLNADKSFTLKVDEAWCDGVVDVVVDWFMDDFDEIASRLMSTLAEQSGVSLDDLIEMSGASDMAGLLEMAGLTKEAFGDDFRKEMAGSIDVEQFAKDANLSGTWEYSKGSVILKADNGKGDELVYDSKANTLTLKDDTMGTVVFKPAAK